MDAGDSDLWDLWEELGCTTCIQEDAQEEATEVERQRATPRERTPVAGLIDPPAPFPLRIGRLRSPAMRFPD